MESIYGESREDLSDIQQFYNGKNIFITGGTGFLGNILIDKLMRSCPGINKIYILTREKKGIEPNERFRQMFDGLVFERMKKERPDYLSVCAPIIGDCLKPNLGINENDQKIIYDADVIFHVAATVRFDAPIRQAVDINIRATRDLLLMAKAATHLKAFIHISTAYSNCATQSFIEEKFYTSPVEPNDLIRVTESLSDEILARITPEIIKPWPNTYAFTKAIAENVVREYGIDLPSGIVRPSIVIATAKEPISGWINNFYGPTGVVAGAGLGLIRTLHCDGECISDLVPVDYVVNSMIASAWNIGVNRKNDGELQNENNDGKLTKSQIPIFNYVSSNGNQLKWKDFMHYNASWGKDIPSVLAVWIYSLTLNKYKFIHNVYCIFLHLLPAIIVDTIAKILRKEPKLWAAYEKIHKFSDVIAYFSNRQWKFCDDNTIALNTSLSKKDKEIFQFNIGDIDWKQYFYNHIRGVRIHLLNDKLETIKEGLKKKRRLQVAHYIMLVLFYCGIMLLAFRMVKWFVNQLS